MHRLYPSFVQRAAAATAVIAVSALVVAVAPVPESRAAQLPSTCANVSIENGSFENPATPANTSRQVNESTMPGWSTTATDDRIEIWHAPFQGVPVPEGVQFVEINATQRSKLYQDVATTPGETIRWQLQHRGRTGIDTMEVRMGAPEAALALQSTLATGQTWRTYSGLYTVPAGQTITRISFDSISSANGNASYGNFVDAVSVTSGACVVTSKSVTNLTGGDTVRLGDTLQYSVTATNQGASDASLTSVIDSLPVGVSLIPGSISVTDGAATTTVTDDLADDAGEFDVDSRELRVRVGSGASSSVGGTLAAGASVTVSFSVTVDSIAALPSVDNTATVAFTDALSAQARVSTSNTTTTAITPDAPSVSIVTSGTVAPAENHHAAALGDTIVWSYVVENTGDVPLSDVTVVDPEGGTITCVPSTLAVGESANCTGTSTHVVASGDLVVGSVSNGATARATPPFGAAPVESAESVATVTTEALAPAISVTVSHDNESTTDADGSIYAGDLLRARFVVTNVGNAALTSIVVTDPVFGTVTCVDDSLEVGESTTCVADELYVVTDDDAETGIMWRTISVAGDAVTGIAALSVSDEQLVSIEVLTELPTFDLPDTGEPDPASPEAELSGLAATGAETEVPLLFALALIGAGLIAVGAARLTAASRRHATTP
ncbi:DUF7507 domain-containing protein [Microcella sp.]|uniref:DUF7507 domain-containing protein n=1 Tax=Microcella sp. TaxID=1913979 RepID=UPI00256909E9|nr:DUF642 domain-containing protein [Microcella sp.]MBX9472082.1 DUF11 domain-containing protein [Microcella sp.]